MSDEVKYNTLNIFWGGNSTGGGGAVWGIGYKRWLYQNSAWDMYYGGLDGPEKLKDNLFHELGHALGLNHNLIEKSCDECSDNDPSTSLCPYQGTSTNIMDYWPGSRSAISECQQKKIHWALMGYYGDISEALIKDYCEIIDPEMVVDDPGNTIVWSHSVYLKGNLRITPTTTLVIKCLVGMPADAKIIVQNGAKLVVDEGYITNMCGELWQGIEVWGVGSSYPHPLVSAIYADTYPTHLTQHHGVVYIMDGSIIEYARNAITTSKYDDFGNPTYRGGIIVAHGASFINCRRSAEFMKYDYIPTGLTENLEDDNISEFYRCNFEVNDDHPDDEILYCHVSMWDVDGVRLVGCTFKDTREDYTNASEGIYSIDATYKVESDLCGGAIPCTEHISTFEGFARGIHVANATYRPRNIEVDAVVFSDNYKGILLSNVDNSLIINNTFEVRDQTSLNSYGLYLEDCTNYQVENNDFTTFGSYDEASPYNAGIYCTNNSNAVTEVYRNYFEGMEAGIRVQTNNTGLQLKCNTFTSEIRRHNIYVTNTGQLGNQGLCLPTGLGYSDEERVNAPAGNKFSHDCIGSESDFKIYSGHAVLEYSHHSPSAYIPNCYTTGATYITLNPCGVSDVIGEYEACQSKLPSGSPGFKVDGSFVLTAAEIMEQVKSIREAISDLEELVNNEGYELEYNSEEINYDDDFLYLKTEKEKLLEDAMNLYILENKLDSAIYAINDEDIEWKAQRTVEINLMAGNLVAASLELSEINNIDIASSDFITLYDLLINIQSEARSLDSANAEEIVILESIAGKQSPSGVAAENLLTYITGVDYEEIFDEDMEDEIRKEITEPLMVNIFPNPASNELFVQISTNYLQSNYSLSMFDITGKLLLETNLDINTINSINIKTLSSGIFFVRINKDSEMIHIEKILKD